MATVERNGITLGLPDHVAVVEDRPRGRRGPAAAPADDTVLSVDDVAQALSDAGNLTVVDIVPLDVGTAPRRPGRRGVDPADTTAVLRVEVTPGEDAVVLVEDDGYYSWVRPERAERRRGTRNASAETLTFTIDLGGIAATPPDGDERRGPLLDALIKPVTTVVFRFLARVAIGQLVKRMERSIVPGLVHIAGTDLESWVPGADLSGTFLPTDRAARVLLLIHGTFSSTRGGFASLAATDVGKAFLGKALSHYDLVIGYDHRTLSEDPLENAEDLLTQLRTLAAPMGLDIDVLTHSRGALVLRSLVEHVLTTDDPVVVTAAAMVAGPNAGTLMASQDNWSTLVDLYTNLAVVGCRFLALGGPQAATVSEILRESVKAIAILIKAIVAEAADEQRVPGIAAMVPGGTFIDDLNRASAPGSSIATKYFVVSSDFDVVGLSGPSGLPVKLLKLVADGFVDRLMAGQRNDLVVDIASMGSIDNNADLVQKSFPLDANDITHHCSYFNDATVVKTLQEWLIGLDGEEGPEPGPDEPLIGESVWSSTDLLDTNFTVIDADTTFNIAMPMIRARDPHFTVIRMADAADAVNHYALTFPELQSLSGGFGPEVTLADSGMLQDIPTSPTTSSIRILAPPTPVDDSPWAARTVLMFDGQPVGVVPEQSVDADAPVLVDDDEGRRHRGPRLDVGEPATPAESPTIAQAYFRAEAEEVITTIEESLVLVDISLEELEESVTASIQAGTADIDTALPITVNIVPRKNIKVVGPKSATVSPPTPGKPKTMSFRVIGARPGAGQVLVIAGQGPVDLVKIVLDVTIVDEVPPEEPVRNAIAAPMPHMPDVTITDQLTIDENVIAARDSSGKETVVETRFDVWYSSEKIDEQIRAETRPISGDRLKYVLDLYSQIEADWGRSEKDAARFNRAMRAFGGQLFDELIPESIQRVLWDNRDTITQIQINSVEPLIPWEIVHLKSPGGALPDTERFLATMGLVRWIDGAKFPPRQVSVTRGRARVIAPTYPEGSGWELTEPQHEFDWMKQTFDASLVEPDEGTIVTLLESPGQFDLLHFAGHGIASAADIANAGLVLEVRKTNGRWTPVPLKALTVEQYARLRLDQGNRPVVFLNACQVGQGGYQLTKAGGFAQAFLKSGAGIFVSTLWSVLDQPARKFTENFYRELIAGRTVAQAATAARLTCRKDGDASWLAYVVYGRPDGKLTLQ